jgi:hypothetical protein
LNPFLRVIEILALVVLPILIFYLRSSWPQREVYINVTILPLIWYLFYAPIHELGHIFGCLIVGLEIKDYQLFSHFWEGSFGFAYVDVKEGFGENIRSFVSLIAPYVFDLISVIIGFYLLTRFKIRNSFLFGLVFLLFNVRPIYDLVDNFIGYFYNHSDFVLASRIAGTLPVFSFVIISVILAVILLLSLLKKYKKYPSLN